MTTMVRKTTAAKFTVVLAASAILGAASSAIADIYVVQVGDGLADLSNASTATFIQKFSDTGGTPVSTISLPVADSGLHKPLTLSGSSTSEGFLALSTNGQYLTLGGYGVAPGQGAVAQTDSAVVNRVVGRIEISGGLVDTTTALTDAYIGSSGNNSNIRSVASTDGTKFFSTGTAFPTTSSAGIRYSELGATTSTQLSDAPTNLRVAKIFEGQLYASSASEPFLGVAAVGTGLPEIAGQTTALLSGFPTTTPPSPSSYDYWFKDANTLYVADDRTVANGGGIQKWTFSDTTWTLAYTLALGTGSGFGARGLTGMIVDGDAILFATTTQASANRLMTITDTGAAAVAAELAAAPSDTAFRGVAFVPSAAPMLVGDYNDDGTVDAADYVTWRDNESTNNPLPNDPAGGMIGQTQYDNWRTNFGTSDAGGGVVAAVAVPEPAGVILVLLGMAAVCGRRRAA